MNSCVLYNHYIMEHILIAPKKVLCHREGPSCLYRPVDGNTPPRKTDFVVYWL
jgi:hypothetical protein